MTMDQLFANVDNAIEQYQQMCEQERTLYEMMQDAESEMNQYSSKASSSENASDQIAAQEHANDAAQRYHQYQKQLQQVQNSKAQALGYLQATRAELENVIKTIQSKLPKIDQSISTFEQMASNPFGSSASTQLPKIRAIRDNYQKNLDDAYSLANRIDSVLNSALSGQGRDLTSIRQKAVRDAWAREKQLVLEGKGTRNWTVAQQAELIKYGSISGFEGQHMLNVANYPEHAGNPDNIQFLTYEEHFYGAHGGDFHNETNGRFDPETGRMIEYANGELPATRIINLTDRYDPSQYDLTTLLGREQGYNRREDIRESRVRHQGEKSR